MDFGKEKNRVNFRKFGNSDFARGEAGSRDILQATKPVTSRIRFLDAIAIGFGGKVTQDGTKQRGNNVYRPGW